MGRYERKVGQGKVKKIVEDYSLADILIEFCLERNMLSFKISAGILTGPAGLEYTIRKLIDEYHKCGLEVNMSENMIMR